MDSFKWDRFVRMLNSNIHPDDLRTSLGNLTLPILRQHVAGFFALKRRGNLLAMQSAHERLRLMIEPSKYGGPVALPKQEPNLSAKRLACGIRRTMWKGWGPACPDRIEAM
jgi:hypothetical protein